MSDEALFKECMSRFATGISVVATSFMGEKYGITVSSLCSVSLKPQLISYCLDRNSSRFDVFFSAAEFVVSVLDETAKQTSISFSQNNTQAWKEEFSTGLELKKALCWVYCRTRYRYDAGDHKIIVAAVEKKKLNVSKPLPLVYYRKGYCSIR
ncbi:flavin reductase family protein [Neorickettsia sennetsu]|uniref:Flavin reductase family protein n=1 Tax=Ehrlichia sennetsu (strain ATCC VR-367 / Miyayama) TaxID=222891 RepID=Q2GCW6_EHRS3|nr:flavin reductase family protein [Neorickettsia sennetsu]ABD46436.1 flavin reductase family protein [Neorickettsia sennetsu str. Miyayama]